METCPSLVTVPQSPPSEEEACERMVYPLAEVKVPQPIASAFAALPVHLKYRPSCAWLPAAASFAPVPRGLHVFVSVAAKVNVPPLSVIVILFPALIFNSLPLVH